MKRRKKRGKEGKEGESKRAARRRGKKEGPRSLLSNETLFGKQGRLP